MVNLCPSSTFQEPKETKEGLFGGQVSRPPPRPAIGYTPSSPGPGLGQFRWGTAQIFWGRGCRVPPKTYSRLSAGLPSGSWNQKVLRRVANIRKSSIQANWSPRHTDALCEGKVRGGSCPCACPVTPTTHDPVLCPAPAENGRKASLTRKFPSLSRKWPGLNCWGSPNTQGHRAQRPGWTR